LKQLRGGEKLPRRRKSHKRSEYLVSPVNADTGRQALGLTLQNLPFGSKICSVAGFCEGGDFADKGGCGESDWSTKGVRRKFREVTCEDGSKICSVAGFCETLLTRAVVVKAIGLQKDSLDIVS